MTAVEDMPPRKRPSGRRTGTSGTRDAILDAARDLFADNGYDGASIRAIAARAGVDPALIRHFFDDKDTLFVATMADRTVIPQRLADAISGEPADRGRRLTAAYLQLWEDDATRRMLLGLVRSAMTTEHGAEMLVDALVGRVWADASLSAADDRLARGIALAGSHLFGTAVARHVLRLPVLTAMTVDELIDLIAPTVQRYLAE